MRSAVGLGKNRSDYPVAVHSQGASSTQKDMDGRAAAVVPSNNLEWVVAEEEEEEDWTDNNDMDADDFTVNTRGISNPRSRRYNDGSARRK